MLTFLTAFFNWTTKLRAPKPVAPGLREKLFECLASLCANFLTSPYILPEVITDFVKIIVSINFGLHLRVKLSDCSHITSQSQTTFCMIAMLFIYNFLQIRSILNTNNFIPRLPRHHQVKDRGENPSLNTSAPAQSFRHISQYDSII